MYEYLLTRYNLPCLRPHIAIVRHYSSPWHKHFTFFVVFAVTCVSYRIILRLGIFVDHAEPYGMPTEFCIILYIERPRWIHKTK